MCIILTSACYLDYLQVKSGIVIIVHIHVRKCVVGHCCDISYKTRSCNNTKFRPKTYNATVSVVNERQVQKRKDKRKEWAYILGLEYRESQFL